MHKNTITDKKNKNKLLLSEIAEHVVDPLNPWSDAGFRAVPPGDSVEKERDYFLCKRSHSELQNNTFQFHRSGT